MVRIRLSNEAFIYADSEARDDLTDGANMVLGGGTHQFYARKIKRMTIAGIQLNLCIPNINVRNNTLVFFSTASGLQHTVTIPEGFYTTVTTASAALQTALNTATGASGLTFTITANPVNSLQIFITAAGGLYHFVTDPFSTMMTRGRALFNLPSETIDSTSKSAGAVFLQYTRFIDILSFSYTEYTKNPMTSNDRGPNNLVTRILLPNVLATSGVSIAGTSFISPTEVSTNYDRSRALEILDLKLTDEFGMDLYLPSFSSHTPQNNSIILVIRTQI